MKKGAEIIPSTLFEKWIIEANKSRQRLSSRIISFLKANYAEDDLFEIDGQTYKAKEYAELLAKTAISEEQTEKTIDSARLYSHDLVEVSNHSTTCEICKEFEGKIYSISGENPKYPKLEKKPPFHPGCRHNILPTSEAAITIREREKEGKYHEKKKSSNEEKLETEKNNPKPRKTPSLGCLAVIIISLAAIGYLLQPKEPKQPAPPKTQEQIHKERIEKHFSAWDGSHIGLTQHIKRSMHDPSSYKHVETRYVDSGDHLIVVTSFRGKNVFGGVVLNKVTAKVDLNGNVLEIISQEPGR